MHIYSTQMERLADRVSRNGLTSLNVYDLDGTLACYTSSEMYNGNFIPMLARSPEYPYIYLSARALEYRWLTKTWCGRYNQKPLAIFHRDKSVWSRERCNIVYYKMMLLEKLGKHLPNVALTFYDDDHDVVLAIRGVADINVVMVERIY